jgi:hypothetical protein
MYLEMEVEEINLFLVPELKVEIHHPLHLHSVVWQGRHVQNKIAKSCSSSFCKL